MVTPALYLVLDEHVPVEELKPGDRLILPNGRRVTVYRIDTYEQEQIYVVRWRRPAEHGEPGHRGGKNHLNAVHDEWDGFYYGSFHAVPAGHTWKVDRARV